MRSIGSYFWILWSCQQMEFALVSWFTVSYWIIKVFIALLVSSYPLTVLNLDLYTETRENETDINIRRLIKSSLRLRIAPCPAVILCPLSVLRPVQGLSSRIKPACLCGRTQVKLYRPQSLMCTCGHKGQGGFDSLNFHFQYCAIRICFLLCSKAPNVRCNTATAACQISGVALPLFSTLIWITNFLKRSYWRARCRVSQTSGNRREREREERAGQSSQLVGEYPDTDTHKGREWGKRERLGLEPPTQFTYCI